MSPNQYPMNADDTFIEVESLEAVDDNERRRYSRYPLGIACEVRLDGQFAPCVISDFSGTGMVLSADVAHSQDAGPSPTLGADRWRRGELVEMRFRLPGYNAPVKATVLVQRVNQVDQTLQIGVAFRGANPAVFDALLKVSDRKRLSSIANPTSSDRRAEARVATDGWSVVASFLQDLLDSCFGRTVEHLHLRAAYTAGGANTSQWCFALVTLKATEHAIRAALVRAVLDSAIAAGQRGMGAETRERMESDGDKLSTDGDEHQSRLRSDALDGLDHVALLELLTRRENEVSLWLGNSREDPVRPKALYSIFQRACVHARLEGETLELVLRSFREAVALHWPLTKRLLRTHLRAERERLEAQYAEQLAEITMLGDSTMFDEAG
ncbi:MAG: PilZ domain-containing protein [Gammaproteobacteria bacterium]